MSNALIVIGHPYWKDSVANRAILEELQKLRPQIKLSNLIELYPDFDIDIEAEQRKLIEADTVVWQFPLMWYSCPSIMRRYLEGVLSYGFAYGSSGSKLENKRLIASITTGVKQSVYEGGILGFSAEDLFKPLAQVLYALGTASGHFWFKFSRSQRRRNQARRDSNQVSGTRSPAE